MKTDRLYILIYVYYYSIYIHLSSTQNLNCNSVITVITILSTPYP